MNNNRKIIFILLLITTISLFMVGCQQTSEVEPSMTNTPIITTSISSQSITTKNNDTTTTSQTTNTTNTTNTQVTTTTKSETITTVTNEKITVPELIGNNVTQLGEIGLTINQISQYSRTISKDIIISQNIKAGTVVSKNQEITLTVSSGLPVITYGYDLISLEVQREYDHGQYHFMINQYDNNVFLRTIDGIIVTHQLIITDCHSMFFDQNDLIYYKKIGDKKLYSFSLSSRENKKIINEAVNYYYLSNTTLFYATDSKVKAYSLSSKNITTIVNIKTNFFQMVNHLYYLANSNGNSYLYEFDGTTSKKLFDTPINSFVIHDFRVYYYENVQLYFIDLLDKQRYLATSEQQLQLDF